MFRMLRIGLLGVVLGLPLAIPQVSDAAPFRGVRCGRVITVRHGPRYHWCYDVHCHRWIYRCY
jgi:hypothetical protein